MNNKKGKGKRSNKPPNPNPPQVKEVLVPETEENIQIEETSEDKNEQRVPEIISEVPTILAEKKDEGDAPKKPKRNRGKKKKQDKDADCEESHDEKPVISPTDEIIASDKIEGVEVDEIGLIQQTKGSELSNIIPTARKKKNKNKKHTQEQLQLEKSDIDETKVNIDIEAVTDDKNAEFKPMTVDEGKLPSTTEMPSVLEKIIIEESLIIDDKPQTALQLEEDTLKAKAKIAKPVDKKRRTFKDSLPEDATVTEILTSEVIGLSGAESKELILASAENVESLKVSGGPISELASMSQFSTGKKRKKSPKLGIEISKGRVKDDINPNVTQEQKENINIYDVMDAEMHTKAVQPVEVSLSMEQQQDMKVEHLPDKMKTDFLDSNKATQEIKLDTLPETSKGKKGKKSPKLPIKIDNVENKVCEIKKNEPTFEKTEQNIEKTGDIKTCGETFYDLPSMEEIEIRSVKADESEGSATEVTPDSIYYPRAISQQHVDNNNNTVIQELIVTDESRLQIPNIIPDTPFKKNLEGSTMSLELAPCSAKIMESEASNTKSEEKQEKTDLKSKMIEVNQDMEELKLSIEKSLAELTALERSDDRVEKQIQAQRQSKIDEKNVSDENIESLKEKCVELTEDDKEVKNTDCKNTEDNKAKENILMDKTPTIVSSQLTEHIEGKDTAKSSMDDKTATPSEVFTDTLTQPVCPTRKDPKGKGKSKKKGKQETVLNTNEKESGDASSSKKDSSESSKKEEKTEKKTETHEKGKQQSLNIIENLNESNTSDDQTDKQNLTDFDPIDNFEDAMTSSIDDVNKTFEMIVDEAQDSQVNPEIGIAASIKDTDIKKDEKINPVSPPKNLLGHPDIPVLLNKTDYKKEKNKPPNTLLAKVKIKDSVQIENKKESKESQTDNIKNLMKKKSIEETFSSMINQNDEYIYKYTFRKVYLPNVCHICKKDLKYARICCTYCHLLFYCCPKHKDEDWPQHQALCFAVSTIGHLKEQKHIYADAKNITGHNYRLLRMQMIVSCEKVLKRKLVPWEQEVLLYPRMCTDVACREWRQNKLMDCDGCGQISYCSDHPEHLTRAHQRWCKSYSLYQKLVCYQQTRGRLEPKLPNRAMTEQYYIPEKINEVLASLYKDKIDMNDIEYAALTQLATAPLTAAYCHQLYTSRLNSTYANGVIKNSSFVIHVVGAELQFEADVLNKWEVFFLHLRPDIQELRVVLVAPDLNPSNLPLDLLQKVKLCDDCYRNNRQLLFSFQDKKTYHEYYDSIDFISPDIICAFNSSIQRSSAYNGNDPWPSTIKCILKLKTPFVITAYTQNELRRDLTRVEEICGLDVNQVAEPKRNPFASVRPDRNFITDDEMPLLFKNYCFSVVCGAF
ncbi:uncharacterized protein ACR2FA_008800 [Aphomia sociella]